MKEEVATYRIEDLREGLTFSFQKTINASDVNGFASLSGDISPLHMDDQFAIGRGFEKRVVHGALLVSYLSRLVGVYFPGENCLVQTLSMKFLSPTYIDTTIEICAVVDQVSRSTNVVVLQIEIKDAKDGRILAKGKVQVGFTQIVRNQ